MCIFPHQQAQPPPAPPPPPAPQKAAQLVEAPVGLKEAQRLAARMGTNQLIIPFQQVNVPQ